MRLMGQYQQLLLLLLKLCLVGGKMAIESLKMVVFVSNKLPSVFVIFFDLMKHLIAPILVVEVIK